MLHAEIRVSGFGAKYRPFPLATVFTYSRLTALIHASRVDMQTLAVILHYNPSDDDEVTLVAFQNSMTRMRISSTLLEVLRCL